MKILIGWFGHETNSFSRKKTDFELLISQGAWEGQEIIDIFTNTPSYLGGMIKCANDHNVELIPTFAVENAGPTVSDECLVFVCDKLLSYIKKHLGEYDGIALGLHGAGVSQTHDDLESYVLRAIRAVVGDKMPITTTYDLHGNITQEMATLSTGLFGIKENPHIDYFPTGYACMDALIKTISGEIALESSVIPIPMLVPITPTDDYIEIKDYINEYKAQHGLLDVCFFPGFPYSDTPITNASVFVTGDGNQLEHAKHIAKYVWDNREKIVDIDSFNEKEAVDKAINWLKENPHGICLINEEADNPGAGTPGDGTDLIRYIFEKNLEDSAFAYIYDLEVVKLAFEAGVGKKITINLGGKIEDPKFHGAPIYLEDVEVLTLSNGDFVATTPLMRGIPGSFGKTACLKHKNVKFVVASVQNQTYDDRAFFVGGIDFSQMRLIALKSSQHFKAFYKNKVDNIIAANPTGIATRNLKLFEYQNLTRPIYPLDDNFDFNPNK